MQLISRSWHMARCPLAIWHFPKLPSGIFSILYPISCYWLFYLWNCGILKQFFLRLLHNQLENSIFRVLYHYIYVILHRGAQSSLSSSFVALVSIIPQRKPIAIHLTLVLHIFILLLLALPLFFWFVMTEPL